MKNHTCKVWSEPQRGYDLSSVSLTACDGDTIGDAGCLTGETVSPAFARPAIGLLDAELRAYVEAIESQLRVYKALAHEIELDPSTAALYVRAARAALVRLSAGREQVWS